MLPLKSAKYTDADISNKDYYDVLIYTKYLKNTLGIFVHNYIAIPSMELEIHPGRFLYGTHHNYGKFKKRSCVVKKMKFCDICMERMLTQANDLSNIWYYPILNCETLTRGLTQHVPISVQTILITGIFTTFIIGIQNPKLFIITFLLIIIQLIYNNSSYKLLTDHCIHYDTR
ncbi:Ac81-like protein [Carcinus maenas nudivirus]|uniref:Ac81-like protein n=1 Tax=Carcinus maenas nudivirus TaxID=2880837 RepID=A0AAE8Y0V4_9VIRU|nr:Ac81-like protein [Carcinus maenas nudivirus]UBZ25666.1 Ac81-like protein [Carcinus maenas nudivirus]